MKKTAYLAFAFLGLVWGSNFRLILKRIAEIPPDAIPLKGLPNLGSDG